MHYLRTVDDADALNSALVEGSSLAVVGGGWIGLEVAAGARDRGVNVTVIEMAELPLMAALGREVGEVFATCTANMVWTFGWGQPCRKSPLPTARRPG